MTVGQGNLSFSGLLKTWIFLRKAFFEIDPRLTPGRQILSSWDGLPGRKVFYAYSFGLSSVCDECLFCVPEALGCALSI